MLVLSRRVGQRIVVSGGITITVLDFRNGAVQIGIDAPQSVRILREEIIHEVIGDFGFGDPVHRGTRSDS